MRSVEGIRRVELGQEMRDRPPQRNAARGRTALDSRTQPKSALTDEPGQPNAGGPTKPTTPSDYRPTDAKYLRAYDVGQPPPRPWHFDNHAYIVLWFPRP